MARRNKNGDALEGVVYLIALMPWWAGVVLAVVSYFWLHGVATSPMPVVAATGQMSAVMTGSAWRGLATVGQYLLPLLCLAGAGMSAFKRRQARQLHGDAANRADGLSQMSWREFEVLVGEYFRRQGFTVTNNGGGGPDGGVDVWLTRGRDRYLVQCKHWRARRVGVEPVREMYGVIAAQRLAGGYVVTSGDFTDEARRFATGRELQLINGKALANGVRAQAANAKSSGKVTASKGAAPVAVEPVFAEVPTEVMRTSHEAAPACPVCGTSMVVRVARQGANAGKRFWGCSDFAQSKCRGTRELA